MPAQDSYFRQGWSRCHVNHCLPSRKCSLQSLPVAASVAFFAAAYPDFCVRLKRVEYAFPRGFPLNDSSQIGQILYGYANVSNFLWNLDRFRFISSRFPRRFILAGRTDLAIFYDRQSFRRNAEKRLGFAYLSHPIFLLLALHHAATFAFVSAS